MVFSSWRIVAGLAIFGAGCPSHVAAIGDGAAIDARVDGPPISGNADGIVSIDTTITTQTIDGFGGANAWQTLPVAGGHVVELLFSLTKGAGLSILRNRIPFREQSGNGGSIPDLNDHFIAYVNGENYQYTANPDGTKTFVLNWDNWDLTDTRQLIGAIGALGADADLETVFSTPWTPPNNSTTNWKVNVADAANYPQIGGSLAPSHYADYADVLADYANGFASNMGAPLAAVSIQNEPDYAADYESCAWSAANIHDFLGVMKGELGKKGIPAGLRVIAPEDDSFEETLVVPTLQDANTADVVGIVGVHQYNFSEPNFGARILPTVQSAGKPLWITEVSQGAANDSSIVDGMYWANMMHTDLAVDGVSSFSYWWLWADASTKAGLISIDGNTVIDNKRLYTFGQFSRFIRPGWRHVAADLEPVTDVLTSAYRDPMSSKIAIVLLNNSDAAKTIDLRLATGTYGAVTAWRTSDTENIAEVDDAITVSGALVRVALPPQSVTTVSGSIGP
jgi:glucuronoarabinoxylan endo-1,4-beta-xylanase